MFEVSPYTPKLIVHTFQMVSVSCFWIIPLQSLTGKRKASEVLARVARNFESYLVKVNNLWLMVDQYIQLRVTIEERVNIYIMSYLLEDVA